MSNIKIVLGKSIDLDKYNPPYNIEWFETHFPEYNFLSYGWRNIQDDEQEDFNAGVRAKGTPNAEDSLGQAFLIDGWKMDSIPPIEDHEGNLLDGRTRRQELRRLGEKWMPVARLKQKVTKTPNSQRRATAINLNDHDYNERKKTEDFVVAVCRDIVDGECKPNEDAIWFHLQHVYKIDKYYDNSKSGIVTKIVSQILRRQKGGTGNTPYQRDTIIEWIAKVKNQMIPTSSAILKTGGNRDEQFITRWVLPQVGKKPEIVVYADGLFAEDSRESVLNFFKDVRKLYNLVFKTVSSSLEGIDITTPVEDCYDLIGIVPTLETPFQQQAWKEHRLLTLEEFLNN